MQTNWDKPIVVGAVPQPMVAHSREAGLFHKNNFGVGAYSWGEGVIRGL